MINSRIDNMLNDLFEIATKERPTRIKAHVDCGVEYNKYSFQSEDGTAKSSMFAIMIAPYSKEEVKVSVNGKNVLEVSFGGIPSCLAKYEDDTVTSNIDFSNRTFKYDLGDDVNRNGLDAVFADNAKSCAALRREKRRAVRRILLPLIFRNILIIFAAEQHPFSFKRDADRQDSAVLLVQIAKDRLCRYQRNCVFRRDAAKQYQNCLHMKNYLFSLFRSVSDGS